MVLIYGAGEAGKLLKRNLEKSGEDVKGFLVSKGYKKFDSYENLPVYEYNLSDGMIENNEVRPDIIYVTTRNKASVICESLQQHGFAVVDLSSDEKFVKIYEDYYLNVLQRNSLNGIDQETLKCKRFSILNPLKMPMKYQLSFYLEIADLFRPAIEDDDQDYTEGPYEQEHVTIEKDDVVIDCGGNIGLLTVDAAAKGAEVYSFEPSTENRKYLAFIEEQFPGQIHIVPTALFDCQGCVNFELTPLGTGCKVINGSADEENCRVVRVQATTIDAFVKENHLAKVDFIKADIEGSERKMLRGATETLRTMHPKLSICTYHLPDDKEVLERIVLEANPKYKIVHRYKKMYAWVEDD